MRKIFIFVAALLSGVTAVTAEDIDTAKVINLNEVVVSGLQAKKETPVAFQNIDNEQLNENNTGQSLPYLFSLTPSVIVTSDGGNGVGYASFRVRGTDANRINITVDGVPLNDSESHGVFWVNMPDFASSVENVQIQRGAGTSTNGAAAFGATVTMETQRSQLKPYAEISSSAGSYRTFSNTFKGGTGLLYDRFIFDARYSNVQTDGYIDRAKVNMNSYYTSAAYYAGNTMLKFQALGSGEVSYQAWNGVSKDMLLTDRRYNSCGEYEEDGEIKFYDNQTDNYWQHHYHLLGSHRFTNSLNMNVTLHYTDGKGYYEDYKAGEEYAAYKLPDYVDSEGNTQEESDLVRRKWLRNDFYGGIFRLNYVKDRINATFGAAANNYVGDHFGRVMWVKTANLLPKPDYEYYRNRGEKLDYNAFVKASYGFARNFSAYIDLQFRGIDYTIKGSDDKAGDNLNVDKVYSFFNPKAGLSYGKNGHSAYASFAVAHREPNRDNFTENGPDAHPTYETLNDYEAGYNYAGKVFSAGVNLYYMDYDNQLILTGKISEIGEALTSNIKDSYRAGIELSAGLKPLSWLEWNVNLTLSRNKIKNYTEFVDTYDTDWNYINQMENYLGTTDISFSPDISGNNILTVKYKGFSATLASSYVSRQYLDNTSDRERSIDPYFVSNLRIGYTFKPQYVNELGIDFSIRNLFNEMYETNGWTYSYLLGSERLNDSGYFAQAGVNFMGRIVLKF
ncbi:MAG: TonB-dependent receptor [Tannerella sp.]|nr:TonB-dependent receptor [Tannerella sp.]